MRWTLAVPAFPTPRNQDGIDTAILARPAESRLPK